MRRKINLLGLLFLLSFISLTAQTPYFYYYNGEKQYLELDTKHIFVSIANEETASVLISNDAKQQPLRVDITEKTPSKNNYKRFWTELSLEYNLSNEAYLTKLSEIKNKEKDIIVAPYFKNKYQDKIGLSNFLYVKLKSLNDTVLLKQEVEKEHAVIVSQNQFMPLWFVISVTEKSKYNAMEMANRFYESKLFQYAEPDLMTDDDVNCVNDQYFGQQWGLRNTGQNGETNGVDIKACDAWQLSTGNNIIVAVLDHGIELNHPDLANNIYPLSFDCETGSSPSTIYGAHGTACAGIIGAIGNNTKGVSGIAPNCKLMSISNSLAGNPLSRQKRADGINWAWNNGADVISNSWVSSMQYQIIDDAIIYATTYGRNGKGCVVVFSSGNNNASTVNYPANLPNVIAVGAVDKCGIRAGRKDIIPNSCDPWCTTCQPGSAYGSALDVVAPGTNVSTTDRQGNNGYNYVTDDSDYPAYYDFSDKDYTGKFGGTSAAAPFVAGVAALVLSVEPKLQGWKVREIIELTAQKVGGYQYVNTPGRNNGDWNNQMGYGLVNAHAAVLAAKSACDFPTDMEIIGPDHLSESSSYHIEAPDGASVQWHYGSCIVNALLADPLTSPNSTAATNTSAGVGVNPQVQTLYVSPNPNCTNCSSYPLNATVSYNGCAVDVPTKEVYIGNAPNSANISTNLNVKAVPSGGKTCRTFIDFVRYNNTTLRPGANILGITGAEWILLANGGVIFPISSSNGRKAGEACELQISSSIANGGRAYINVRVKNECGWSNSVLVTYIKAPCSNIRVSYSPNPTNNELIVNFEELPTMENMDEFSAMENVDDASTTENIDVLSMPQNSTNANQTETYFVKLLDASGVVLRESQFTHSCGTGAPQPVRFNVSSLRKGTYFLHVEGGGELVREQIVVTK